MSAPTLIRLSLAVLAGMVLAILGVGYLAYNTATIETYVEREIALLEAENGLYYFDNGHVDEGDNVLVGQLPRDDFSRGGVYFIGSSVTNTMFMPWKLTDSERTLIRNYSLGDLRHSDIKHYLQMLVRDFDLLKAGPDKTTIILPLGFQLTRAPDESTYVRDLFHRHRLYTYDREAGIARVPMLGFQRDLVLHRERINRYLHLLFSPSSRVRFEGDSHEEMIEHMGRVMAGDWRTQMAVEVQELKNQIDYLQNLNVAVWVVRVPSISLQSTLPYEKAYYEMVMPILTEKGVRIFDYRDAAPDEDFMDAYHLRYHGQVLMHRELYSMACQALVTMGTIPEPSQRPDAFAADKSPGQIC